MMMKNAVLAAIGDELLSGVRLEKNANFMAWHLHNKGVEVKSIEVISDEECEIVNLLSRHVGKTDLLILSGGLGPTHDDKTRYAIAKFLGCELYSDSLYDRILDRASVRNNPERLARLEKSRDTQSMIPVKAQAVYNPAGSALGITFTLDGTRVLALPGVPFEYEAMTRQEFPEIFAKDDASHCWASVIILGLPEVEIARRIPEVIGNSELHVSILPAFPQVELIIRGESKLVDDAERLTRSRFTKNVLPKGCHSLAEAVLYESKLTHSKISCAESCTGGLVGAALTEIPGSSESFMGSAVTYSNEAKSRILGVSSSILDTFGAVSEQCAVSMAEGSLRVYDSDYAVSITGIAGPDGGSKSKPVGTVWFGLASHEKSRAFVKVLPGSRSEIRTRAARFALAELWRMIHKGNPEPEL